MIAGTVVIEDMSITFVEHDGQMLTTLHNSVNNTTKVVELDATTLASILFWGLDDSGDGEVHSRDLMEAIYTRKGIIGGFGVLP